MKIRLSKGNFIFNNIHTCNMYKKNGIMSIYIKKNKFLFILTILTSVISSLGYVFMAVLLQQLLDIAMDKNIQQFIKMVIFSIIYFVVLGFSLYLQSLLSKKVICKIMLQIRSDVFRRTINHSIEDFEKKNTADYISVVTNDVKMLEDNFLLPLFEVVQYTVIFISSFVLMIYFDIIVTICVIVAIAVMFLIPSLLGGTLEKRQNKFSSKLAEFTVSLKDILSGFEIIKSYSMSKTVIQRFERVKTEEPELFDAEDKNSPWKIYRKGTQYTVTFGTHICTQKWFNSKEEANEYINSKPWELIFIGMMIFRDKCKEIANNKK